MRNADYPTFGALMAGLAMAFRQELDPEHVEIMWMGLGDLPLDGFTKAAQKALRTCKFFPTVAELRELTPRDPDAPKFMPGAGYVPLIEAVAKRGRWTPEEQAEARAMIAEFAERFPPFDLRRKSPPPRTREPGEDDK